MTVNDPGWRHASRDIEVIENGHVDKVRRAADAAGWLEFRLRLLYKDITELPQYCLREMSTQYLLPEPPCGWQMATLLDLAMQLRQRRPTCYYRGDDAIERIIDLLRPQYQGLMRRRVEYLLQPLERLNSTSGVDLYRMYLDLAESCMTEDVTTVDEFGSNWSR